VWAWGALALTIGFILLTAWWLSIDRSVPYNDAAQHLWFAYAIRYAFEAGQLGEVLDLPSYYPPATFLLGAAATYVGGLGVVAPILAQNVVFVPLLALACYQMARMLAGPMAGFLAVVFALGAPLVAEQFHVFMLDVPQAALVAVTAWLILASDRFARIGVSALAGLVLGWALASKQLAPLYLVGLIGCVLARGGWRSWRGVAAFATVALLVAAPWYVRQVTIGHGAGFLKAAGSGGDVPPAAKPALLSAANLAWYLWATLNGLLFAPLFAFAAVGVGRALTRARRTSPRSDVTLELLCGLAGAWLALTVMPHKDMRYALGLIGYLAVLGTVWIVHLRGAARIAVVTSLLVAVLLVHLGMTFGVGGESFRRLPGNRNAAYGEGVPPRGRVIVYANRDYMVSGPRSSPDVLCVMRGLRRAGVARIGWDDRIEVKDPYIEGQGLLALSLAAKVEFNPEPGAMAVPGPGEAVVIRAHAMPELGRACARFADGSGLWIRVAGRPGSPQTVCLQPA
jgi:4-amino-4-deoxy-L-arabinose transferase-like glycosyltransferase